VTFAGHFSPIAAGDSPSLLHVNPPFLLVFGFFLLEFVAVDESNVIVFLPLTIYLKGLACAIPLPPLVLVSLASLGLVIDGTTLILLGLLCRSLLKTPSIVSTNFTAFGKTFRNSTDTTG